MLLFVARLLLKTRALTNHTHTPVLFVLSAFEELFRQFIAAGLDPAAAAADRRLLERSEEWARSQADFMRADANRSGEVDLAELRGLLNTLFGSFIPGGQVPLSLARLLMRTFDTSGDGKLDSFEFLCVAEGGRKTLRLLLPRILSHSSLPQPHNHCSHLDMLMHCAKNYIASQLVPLRRAAGRPPRPTYQDAYMTRAEVRQFLIQYKIDLPEAVRGLMEDTASYEEASGGAGGLAIAGVGGLAGVLGGGGMVAGARYTGGALPLGWPVAGAPGGAGAMAGAVGVGAGGAWAPFPEGEEILPFTGVMRLCAQIHMAQMFCQRVPRTADGTAYSVSSTMLWQLVFLTQG